MDAEILTEVIRGPLVESKHRGHVAIVNHQGELLYYNGKPKKVIFARSSMKPLQAIPIVETGAALAYQLEEADLSIACASHSGEAQHTEQVTSILNKLNLSVSDLQCGTHPPRWRKTDEEIMRAGKVVTPIYNNCSGKHSGMLATARYMEESLNDYYKIDHPVQQRIIEVISDLTEVPQDEIEIGIDGCGVPVHGVPLENLALSFAKMANPENLEKGRKDAIYKVTKGMMDAPEMVGGTERFCTDFMNVAAGTMFGKAGAEGVYCIGDIKTGIGIAIKIEDGGGRATSAVAVEILKQLNLLSEKQLKLLESYHYPKMKNARDEEIGYINPVLKLKNASSILS